MLENTVECYFYIRRGLLFEEADGFHFKMLVQPQLFIDDCAWWYSQSWLFNLLQHINIDEVNNAFVIFCTGDFFNILSMEKQMQVKSYFTAAGK